jgi:hypothetical protein
MAMVLDHELDALARLETPRERNARIDLDAPGQPAFC